MAGDRAIITHRKIDEEADSDSLIDTLPLPNLHLLTTAGR
jgi:hypothetical protein